mgnify:CR=1 FL=1
MRFEERRQFFKWATKSAATPFWYGKLYGDEIPSYIVFKHEWPDYYFNDTRPLDGRCFSIILDGEAIGQINYNQIDPITRQVDLDILIASQENQGHGYGSDAIYTLTRYLFEEMGVSTCKIEVSPANPRAIKAYRKAGYEETDSFTQNDIPWLEMKVEAEDFALISA